MEMIRSTIDRAEDLGYVHAMGWKQAYAGTVPQSVLDNITPERRAEAYRSQLTPGQDKYNIAFIDSRPAGMLAIGKSRDTKFAENAGEIFAFYFLSDYWGKGYGKQMMDFAIERLKESGFDRIALWALEENQRARVLYESFGFVFDGTKKEINNGKPLMEMR